MQQELRDIRFLVGNQMLLSNISNSPVTSLFSDHILRFLDDLSKWLMNNSTAKQYPDVIAFAFWIRKSSMEREKMNFQSKYQRVGRGLVFHIAPSNIPVQFAVSLVYALVSGNSSIVRVSNKVFPQVDIICEGINNLLEERYEELKSHICIVRYDHDNYINKTFSEMCDIRIIWGGNETIESIRKIPTAPRCIDLGFADRYSFSIIESDHYLEGKIEHIANDFYNDTFFSDQNACSSPRMIVWLGNHVDEARIKFWDSLSSIVKKKYDLNPICGSDKLLNTVICAAVHPGIKQIKTDNYIVRIELPKLFEDIMDYKGNCGYFFEYCAKDITDVLPLLKKECQTITYIGDIENKIRTMIVDNSVRGVDRIVPVGHGADISLIWDGFEIPFVLSRCIGNK